MIPKNFALFAVAVVGLVLLSAAVEAEDVENDACLACHGAEDLVGPEGQSLFVGADAFAASVHAPLPCVTCHVDAATLPHEEKPAAVPLSTCATCHEDPVGEYEQSVHGTSRSSGHGEAATCADCHGNLHNVTAHSEPTSTTHWSKMAATCARCHASVEMAKKFKIPVVQPAEAYLQSAHARAVAQGRHAATCSDCHGAHDILSNTDPSSKILHANVPVTCGKCHADILATYRESVHGEALARGARDAPVCTDCHGEHRILGPGDIASPVSATKVSSETCGRCHSSWRLSEKYGFDAQKVSAFRDSYHGLAGRGGKATVANCSSCHGVHDIRPSSDPRSSINAANLSATCGKCHPGAGANFTIGSVHGAGNAPGTWAAAWVRWIYLWLIAGTISFMFVHNALDFSRKVRRQRMGPPPMPLGQPERMTRPLRWQHGLTLVSFTLLVITGFALKYPESSWAAAFVYYEGSLGLRGLIHRIAAVVMIVALVWHVGLLCVNRRLRNCIVYGMLPSRHDAKVLSGMLAYYFRMRRTPPHSGTTFNYAEKAEYLAFMWGSVVMVVTGFALWFSNRTLEYLPGWVPNVATAIHFYEAILATLAIVVWHFYWVIFDPDVYPLDPTLWDGHPPASRVVERLPHEDAAGAAGESEGTHAS
ncbi:MAG: Cytochrome b subunit of formate dehydrogenase-like protein [Deltaproteobacteria bacterium]|nr:Cytochrome b subunit of formate dehydrogenase-like protein [Deltaproteobacteria bacterium]